MVGNYICALDIGSSKISGAVASLKGKAITRIFLDTIPTKGIKKGVIIDPIELVNALSRLLKNLKNKSKINIKYIYTNLTDLDITTKHSRAIIPLTERGNKVITLSDIQKVNAQARILGSSLEEEIIYALPVNYTIDTKTNVLNPLGLYSHRLEVDLYLVSSKISRLKTLSRVINQAGFEVKDLYLCGIATAQAISQKSFKAGLNILCDMGSDITEILIFQDGVLKDMQILSIGGDDLTQALAEELKIPLDLAEDIKRSYGMVGDSSHIEPDKEILVKKESIYKPIKQKVVCGILTAKAKSIGAQIKDRLNKIVACSDVNTFIVCGRTVLLEGFMEMLENSLGISVKLARITNPDIVSFVEQNEALSGQKGLTYLTALGIICQALQERRLPTPSPYQNPRNILLKAINRFKEIYQEYF